MGRPLALTGMFTSSSLKAIISSNARAAASARDCSVLPPSAPEAAPGDLGAAVPAGREKSGKIGDGRPPARGKDSIDAAGLGRERGGDAPGARPRGAPAGAGAGARAGNGAGP